MERAQVARLRALYPARTDDEVLQLWRDAGDSVRERDGMIDYLYNEREAMNVALGQWLHGRPALRGRPGRRRLYVSSDVGPGRPPVTGRPWSRN